jgi:hypothetical protein
LIASACPAASFATAIGTGLAASVSPGATSFAAIHSSLLTIRLSAAALDVSGLRGRAFAGVLACAFTRVFRHGVFRRRVFRAVFTGFSPGARSRLSLAAAEKFAHLLRRHALWTEA